MKVVRTITLALLALTLSTGSAWAKDIRTVVFKVAQLECENCERKVKQNIRFEKGIKSFTTDLSTRTVTITYDADKTSVEKLQQGFRKFDYEAEFIKETKAEKKKSKSGKGK